MKNNLHPISLLTFVDYYYTPSLHKDAKMQEFGQNYGREKDLYKIIRETIIRTHKKNLLPTALNQALVGLTDQTKIKHYPLIIDAYKEWWGNNNIKWLKPPKAPYIRHGVQISVNPELGLVINGTPYLIKLYFCQPIFQPMWAHMTISLMSHVLTQFCNDPEITKMAVLDVRREKLFTDYENIDDYQGGIDNELSRIARYYSNN
jgi:hypothetical protein